MNEADRERLETIKIYAESRSDDQKLWLITQLEAAKVEIEQLKITHINQADVITRQHVLIANGNLEIARINQVAEEELDEVNAKAEKLTKALKFYGDPQTYFAIAFIADPPCGDFATDESETDESGIRPGKRARQALADTEDKR